MEPGFERIWWKIKMINSTESTLFVLSSYLESSWIWHILAQYFGTCWHILLFLRYIYDTMLPVYMGGFLFLSWSSIKAHIAVRTRLKGRHPQFHAWTLPHDRDDRSDDRDVGIESISADEHGRVTRFQVAADRDELKFKCAFWMTIVFLQKITRIRSQQGEGGSHQPVENFSGIFDGEFGWHVLGLICQYYSCRSQVLFFMQSISIG